MPKATMDESVEVIERVKDAVDYMAQFDLYEETLSEANIEPDDIRSLQDFRTIPFLDSKTLAQQFEDGPPFGSLLEPGRTPTRCNFTPNPYIDTMPVIWTDIDIELNEKLSGEAFRNIGITEDDIVLNTMSFTPYPSGWTISDSIEAIGATHIPSGPGETERKVEIIDKYDVSVLVGFPSFILEIADESDTTLDGIEIVVGNGEPFTAIEGYREQVRDAYGGDVTVVDGYGLAEVGGGYIAIESREESGMHVLTDRVFPEVINPETGEILDRGEKGELVVTSVQREAPPLLRFRTGDLTRLEKVDSQYGEYLLPDGVFGRTDNQLKVKGVKIYPTELQMFLAGMDGINAKHVQVKLTQPDNTVDNLSITVNGEPDVVDREKLQREIESRIRLSVDELTVDPDFNLGGGEVVVDER